MLFIRLFFPFSIFLSSATTVSTTVTITVTLHLWRLLRKITQTQFCSLFYRLPYPRIPRISLFSSLILDSIILSFVIYSICLSLGKIYAKKLSYEIRPNQEFIALGISNALSSFFLCFPAAGSLSRSSVQGQYGKSHMASIISCFILLFVILFLSPLLYYLPKCAVAIIIILSQRSLLFQVTDLKTAWTISKWEGLIWLVTFTSVILLGIDYGLLIGIAFSIFTIVLRFVNPKLRRMGQLSDTGIFLDVDHHSGLQVSVCVCLFSLTCLFTFEWLAKCTFLKMLRVICVQWVTFEKVFGMIWIVCYFALYVHVCQCQWWR